MKKINYEEFQEQYKPIKNPFVQDAPYDGCMFETHGIEVAYVREQDNKKIWTLVDAENENQYVIPGFNIVNRFGHFICENEWEDEDIEVDDNQYITKEEAINHCFNFWKQNGFQFNIELIKGFYSTKETYTIGEAKYLTIDVYEEITGAEPTAKQEDNIHDYYLQL